MFTQDFILQKIYVKGEVSNCKYHTSGHIYFSLKDETGVLSCVMFAGHRRGLAFRMKDGDRVVVGGAVDVYERDGRYQLYAKEIKREGRGDLFCRFEKLRDELEEMGMFDGCYKQPIPKYATRIGIVTASTGAAIRDIMNITSRRNPYVQLILYPALVQGEKAKYSIVQGIKTLDQMGLDVLIVGRGGGSIEDLWAFNEEMVARAIFECHTPVISAVGHETDVTIADYVADLRAPTPSAAAELAVVDYRQLVESVRIFKNQLADRVEQKIVRNRDRARYLQARLLQASPQYQLREKRQYAADLNDKMRQAFSDKVKDRRHRLALYAERLDGCSPLKKLQQGYSYTESPDGKALTSITQVKEGDAVTIHVTDGTVVARTEGIRSLERNG